MKFDIEIPKWAKWLTQDKDGDWSAHREKPFPGLQGSIWISLGNRQYVAFSNEQVKNWQSQLYEIYYE